MLESAQGNECAKETEVEDEADIHLSVSLSPTDKLQMLEICP